MKRTLNDWIDETEKLFDDHVAGSIDNETAGHRNAIIRTVISASALQMEASRKLQGAEPPRILMANTSPNKK